MDGLKEHFPVRSAAGGDFPPAPSAVTIDP